MKNNRIVTVLIVLMIFQGLAASFAYADDMWVKFGRGFANIISCPAEIPVHMAEMGKTERWPIAAFGGGLKGVFYTLARAVAGVYEIVTFPVPVPRNYEPVMKPEFVIPTS